MELISCLCLWSQNPIISEESTPILKPRMWSQNFLKYLHTVASTLTRHTYCCVRERLISSLILYQLHRTKLISRLVEWAPIDLQSQNHLSLCWWRPEQAPQWTPNPQAHRRASLKELCQIVKEPTDYPPTNFQDNLFSEEPVRSKWVYLLCSGLWLMPPPCILPSLPASNSSPVPFPDLLYPSLLLALNSLSTSPHS